MGRGGACVATRGCANLFVFARTASSGTSPMRLPRFSAPTLLLTPAFVVLAAVVVVPLLLSLYSSFTPFRLTRPETFWTFTGTRNYVNILTDRDFWIAFARTVVLLTVAL